MAELIVVRQKSDFTTSFLAVDSEAPEGGAPQPVAHIHELTPYGMMLAGLATCTAMLLHSYAKNRRLPLDEVELTVAYRRDHRKDCRDCKPEESYEEGIQVDLRLIGGLQPEDREKMLAVSRHCPVEKILARGIAINTRLVEAAAEPAP